jgi:nitroreductase
MDDFFELLNKRRSIRNYHDKAVPMDLLTDIITESCLAPSASNGQPWKFIIICDKNMIKRLSDESKKNLVTALESEPDSSSRQYEAILRNKSFNVFYNAPCLVFIVGSRKLRSLPVDCSLAACYFMFSAAARGLGTCWVGLGRDIQDPAIRSELGLTAEMGIVAPIIVGYPNESPTAPLRNKPDILKVVS